MIERLKLINVQRHRAREIVFDPGVTCVVGPTDAGKSAILRALRWLCFNKPSGKGLLRWGSKFTKVEAVVDGHVVVRKRGKRNCYLLDGKVFTALGTAVPRDVEKLLNVSSDNFQRQHDAPFWFSCTAGQVSKELNALVNLHSIDHSLAFLQSAVRKAKASKVEADSRAADLQRRRTKLTFVPLLAREAETVLKREKELTTQRARCDSAGVLVTKVKTCTQTVERLTQAHLACDKVAREGREALALGTRVKRLDFMVRELHEVREQVRMKLPDTRPLTQTQKGLAAAGRRIQRLTELLAQANQLKDQSCQVSELLGNVEKQLLKAGRCPTCKRILVSPSCAQTSTSH